MAPNGTMPPPMSARGVAGEVGRSSRLSGTVTLPKLDLKGADNSFTAAEKANSRSSGFRTQRNMGRELFASAASWMADEIGGNHSGQPLGAEALGTTQGISTTGNFRAPLTAREKRGGHARSAAKMSPEETEVQKYCKKIGLKAAQKYTRTRDALRYVDSDGDGVVTRSEMRYFFRAYDFGPEVADLFSNFLDDGSGVVQYADFTAYISPYMDVQDNITAHFLDVEEPVFAPSTPASAGLDDRKRQEITGKFRGILEIIGSKAAQKFSNVRHAFRYVDCNHDGTISQDEMRYFFRAFNIPEDVADSFFEGLKEESSDFVDYNTFVGLMGPFIMPSHHGATTKVFKPKYSFRHVVNPNRAAAAARQAAGTALNAEHAADTVEATSPREPLTQRAADGRDQNADLKDELKNLFKDLGRKLNFKFKHPSNAFKVLDLERNGRIRRKEMVAFFRGFGYNEAKADKVFDLLVEPGQGNTVDFEFFMKQFETVLGPGFRCARRQPLIPVTDPVLSKAVNDIAIMIQERMTTKYRRITDAFRSLDLDKSGKISQTEMSTFLRQFGLQPEMASMFFRALDEDGSEEILYDEFMSLFSNEADKKPDQEPTKMPIVHRMS